MFQLSDSNDGSFNWGYIGAVISFVLFRINSRRILPAYAPELIKETDHKLWKWKNTTNSLIHSCITGFGAIVNLLFSSQLVSDVVEGYSFSTVAINSVTVGYFIYDFFDLLDNQRRTPYELLVHHVVVTLCFGLALVTKKYQGFAMISLLVEINSIFLHLRQLFILHNISKRDSTFKKVIHLNIGTFFIFRILPLSWQMRWLLNNQNEISYSVFLLGTYTMTIILILNLILLWQVVYKDFIKNEERVHFE